jgi:thymidylate kinase
MVYRQDNQSNRIVVEFIGSPGSGKSSLVPLLVDGLREQGLHAVTIKDAIQPFAMRTALGKTTRLIMPPAVQAALNRRIFSMYSALFRRQFYRKNSSLLSSVRETQRQRPVDAGVRQRRILRHFYRLAGYYEFITSRAEPGEVVVFDEGFVHKVVALNVSEVESPNPFQVMDYLDMLPPPDLVVFVRAPLEVCEARLRERGLWRFMHNKTEMQVTQFIANAHQVVHLAVQHLKSKGWPVIEVDNSRTLDFAEQQLRQALKGWLDPRMNGHGVGREYQYPAKQARNQQPIKRKKDEQDQRQVERRIGP